MNTSEQTTQTAPASAGSRLRYVAYGLLGMPLAMSALPVYVQVPVYYTGNLGLALGSTGWVLFLARLIDTVQDPWLGRCIDRLDGMRLKLWLIAGALLLAAAFGGVWLPPPVVRSSETYLLAWLGAMLVIAYTAHSMLNIAYMSWGARLSERANGLLGAAALRELAGLLGALVAGAVPSLILAGSGPFDLKLAAYAAVFSILLALALAALLRLAPPWKKISTGLVGWRESFSTMGANAGFRRLLLPYFLNAMSMAIPVTLALFFINDRLRLPQYGGIFIAVYFLAAVSGLPLWVAVAKRVGVSGAWRAGMLLAIVSFGGVALLGAGDTWPYAVICVTSGLALGADLALPPVLLATLIGKAESPAAYYGIWALLGKLSLAVAGLALPLLAALGYQPGTPAGMALTWVYALLPCLFKLLALALLRSLHAAPPEPVVAAVSLESS